MLCRVIHNKNYTVINNTICTDKRLSWKAKGIWLYAFSRPDDWEFYLCDIINQSTDGKDSVSSGVKELEEVGYLIRRRTRDDKGRVTGFEWIFLETPSTQHCEPEAENPDMGKAEVDKPPLLNTEIQTSTERQQQPAVFFDHLSFSTKQPCDKNVQLKDTLPAENETYEKPVQLKTLYDFLTNLDIPDFEKQWLTDNYDYDIVKNATEWASDAKNPPTKSLSASIKFACRNGLYKPKKTIEEINRDKAELEKKEYMENFNRNKDYAKKHNGLIQGDSCINALDTCVRIYHLMKEKTVTLDYFLEGFIEQFKSALKKNNFIPLPC